MPVCARRTTIDEEFGDKRGPGGVISCGDCKRNLAEDPFETVHIIYVDMHAVKTESPHGVYCQECLESDFRKPVII